MHTGAVTYGYLGIVLVLVIGIAVVGYGWLSDRSATKRQLAELDQAPDHPITGIDERAGKPSYLSAAAAMRPTSTAELSEGDRAAIEAGLQEAPNLNYGHAAEEFVTDPPTKWCVLPHPQVLVLEQPLQDPRELRTVLRVAAATEGPIVVVAPALSSEALGTFRANIAQGKFAGTVVLIEPEPDRARLTELTGATPVDRSDLQADYVPASTLGACGLWVSTASQLWLLPADPRG